MLLATHTSTLVNIMLPCWNFICTSCYGQYFVVVKATKFVDMRVFSHRIRRDRKSEVLTHSLQQLRASYCLAIEATLSLLRTVKNGEGGLNNCKTWVPGCKIVLYIRDVYLIVTLMKNLYTHTIIETIYFH